MNRKAVQLALVALFAGPACALAQDTSPARPDTTSNAGKEEAVASRHVLDATAAVQKAGREDGMRTLLSNAKGVFIVPSYGRAALGVGAGGGAGVLLVRRDDGTWSEPVFYRTGGLSVGLQAGAQGGMLVLVLNNQKAVDVFLKKTNLSLNAKAGLTILNWSKLLQDSAGTGDIVAWADTKGLFGDLATVEVNGIRFSQKLNNAYYRRTLSASDVIGGKTSNPQADPLRTALDTAGPAH
jgi:lipid-binding SYLF domain-containing protein